MITIHAPQSSYRPGETIVGSLQWEELDEATPIDVRLVWHTQGKGTQAFEVVHSQVVQASGRSGTIPFQMTAPEWPHSFSGKLLSLRWVLEAVGSANLTSLPVSLVISPTGEELHLPYNDEQSKKNIFSWGALPQ